MALLPGCLVTPPKVALHAERGLVRAESAVQARYVAKLLDDLAPRVQGLLPDTRSDPLEVWVQSELAIYSHWQVERDVPAFTIEGGRRIHMRSADPRELSTALGHELVHAMLGDSWSSLPAVAEEGLADWVQEQLHPDLASSLRADHLSKTSAAFDGLQLGIWLPSASGQHQLAAFTFLGRPEGTPPLGPPSTAIARRGGCGSGMFQPYEVSVSDPRLYGLGYLLVARIVERHGMAELHALCLKASEFGLETVPSPWLLERAGLDDDPASWRLAVAARFGRLEITALGRTLVPFLVRMLAEDVSDQVRASSGDEFLRRYRPRLGLVEADLRVPLSQVPDLRSALRRAWPGQGSRTGVVAAR